MLPTYSLGVLHVIPILIVALVEDRLMISLFASPFLAELFSVANWMMDRSSRLALVILAFAAIGLLVWELVRTRRLALWHVKELQREGRLRRITQRSIRTLVETSPLGVFVINAEGKVRIANASAHRLLAVPEGTLVGQDIREYIPLLARPLTHKQLTPHLRVAVECSGYRSNGDVFVAQVWFSTHRNRSGTQITAMVWDASEDLRERGSASLDAVMRSSRVLMGAVSHEMRNLAAAARAAFGRLRATAAPAQQNDLLAIGVLLEALERVASRGLDLTAASIEQRIELNRVLDEFTVVVVPLFREINAEVHIEHVDGKVWVAADHHLLLQVMLNLARNSQRVLQKSPRRRFETKGKVDERLVSLEIEDTGPGIPDPEALFKPFHATSGGSGLGLFLSRAVVRSFGGDLRYEPTKSGTCFVVQLLRVRR